MVLGIDNYHDALNEVSEIVDRTGIGSLYQYGSVNHPGISDLDLLVINSSPFNKDLYLDFENKLLSISEKTNFIIGHASIITIPHDSARNLCFFDNLDLKLITGKDYKVQRINDGPNNITYLRLLDWAPERFLATIYVSQNISVLDKRFLLCFLNSVGYTLIQGNKFGCNADTDLFIDAVKDLRDRSCKGIVVLLSDIKYLLKLGRNLLLEILDFLSTHELSKLVSEQLSNHVESLTVDIKRRGRIFFKHGLPLALQDSRLTLPLGMALNWYALSNGGQDLCEHLTVRRITPLEETFNLSSASDLMTLAAKRGKIGRDWIEYKRFHGGAPKILKYNFFS